jgi:hypothetical protein
MLAKQYSEIIRTGEELEEAGLPVQRDRKTPSYYNVLRNPRKMRYNNGKCNSGGRYSTRPKRARKPDKAEGKIMIIQSARPSKMERKLWA